MIKILSGIYYLLSSMNLSNFSVLLVTSPKSGSFHEFLDKDECEHVKLKRISHIHRAVSVTSDLKGRNFAVIQVHPKSGLLQIPFVESTEMKQNMKSLLDTADEYDSIHDVVFQVYLIMFLCF